MEKTRIDDALNDAARGVPGLAAFAAHRDGTLYEGAFGVPADAIFHFASMTKAVTSVAAMQLVERGRLALDGPISDVLPALRKPQVLVGFDGDRPLYRPAAGPVTLRQLLTHTAGYAYNMWNEAMHRWVALTGRPRVPETDEQLADFPLVNDPGAGWYYGISTDVVGLAVEAVSGMRLHEYWQAHVFAPLGMTETGVTLPPERRGRLVPCHARAPDGTLTPLDVPTGLGPAYAMGGGALCGTGRDYLRFLRMLLGGGTLDGVAILAPETVSEMGRNHIGAIDMPVMRTSMPAQTNDVDMMPGITKKWGLGFLMNTRQGPDGRRSGSLAWAGLRNTFYWIDPAAGVTGLVLTQILPFMDPGTLAALSALERAVYGI